MNNNINNILIPNISKLPTQKSVQLKEKLESDFENSEFKNLLSKSLENKKIPENYGVNLSVHAVKRLEERNLNIDSDEFLKLKGAIDKLKMKGGQDSLVITGKAAYIVDVPNKKIVTAIDKDNMAENVFTKIDSTLIVN